MNSGYRTGILDQYRSRQGSHVLGGASVARREPPVLQWVWAHDHAFDVTPGDQGGLPPEQRGERWHSGHLEAVCPLGTSVLVGADNGGAWLVNPVFDAVPASESFPARPLSFGWENPYVRCLQALPGEPPRLVFAGLDEVGPEYLAAIELTPILGGFDVAGTRMIPPPPARGIWAILFVDDTTLLAGTGDGVWWAVVDDDPASSWVPAWHHATGIWGRVTSLAQGPGRSVIAGAQGFPGPAGVWHGTWAAASPTDLAFTQPLPTSGRTSVASCAADRTVAYAVAAAPNEKVQGVWRSGDGGASWSMVAAPLDGGDQGSYNNCIAVNPTDSNMVGVGWRSGPFMLDNAAGTWERRTDEPNGHMHSDVHALAFAPGADGNVDLWAGTDGGVCVSHDLGKTWDSRYNRHLLTAQVYSTLGHTLEEYNLGTPPSTIYERDNSSFHVSASTAGLFGVATQDDGTLISRESPAGHRSLWPSDGGDGQGVLFAGDNLVFHTNNTSNRLKMSRLLPTGVLDDGSVVPVDGNAAGLPKVALAATYRPSHRIDGRRVIGVAGGAMNVLALLEPTSGSTTADLQTVANVAQVISAVATLDGRQALVGTVDGHLYAVDLDTGSVTTETVPANAPGPVRRLRWRGANHRLAVFGNDRIFRGTDAGWVELPGPTPAVFDVDGDPDLGDGTLFAATGDGVFASADLGTTWVDSSVGLPRWPNGRSVQVTNAGDEPAIYFATYGWGVFRASLREDDTVKIPEIDDEMVDILFGIISDGDGVEIVGGVLRRVPPRGPARELALALGSRVLASALDDPEAVGLATSAATLARRLAIASFDGQRGGHP